MGKLKAWLESQLHERWVEPNSSLGKAFQYLLSHWAPADAILMGARRTAR
jgi:hypothetical protein